MKAKSNTALIEGTIYKKTTGWIYVQSPNGLIACTLAPHLTKTAANGPARGKRAAAERPDEDHYAALGDRVRFTLLENGAGILEEVLPRRNQFWRRAALSKPGEHPTGQVIAANLDQVIPVFAAAAPPPHWNMLDRYLVSAEAAGIPAKICITKMDLAAEGCEDLHSVVEEYRRIGYPMLLVSAFAGRGLDELRAELQGCTSALLGKSGVGKTSLLNALQPGLGQRVSAISEFNGKGRHTTTHLELFPLDFGGALLDTPGVREFGLWGVEGEDLAWFFPEMRPYLGACRFGSGCRHAEEPGCAVRKAVVAGQISPRRYKSYMRLQEDQ